MAFAPTNSPPPPNFYRVVSYVSKLNQMYGLQLNHHDINFMYSLCRNIRFEYYLKTRDMGVRLISCLPDSNINSAGEFVWVSGNWLADELPCPLSPRNVGRYQAFMLFFFLIAFILDYFTQVGTNQLLCYFDAESKRYRPDLRVVHVRDLNFVL